MGNTMFRSGRRFGLPIRPAVSSGDRNCLPSIRPPHASGAYIFARPRAVAVPLAAGISPSRNGMSPCTTENISGKYSAPRPPDHCSAASFGTTAPSTAVLDARPAG